MSHGEEVHLQTDVLRLPEDARPGRVLLRVRDLDRALGFYEGILRLQAHPLAEGSDPAGVRLTAPGHDETLVVLEWARDAPPPPPGATGLFHLALLLPSRRELGRLLRHLRESGTPLQGASDHAVSEAVYLADPEGNGVEIYADRDSRLWPRSEREIHLVTEPLDVASLLQEAAGEAPWESFSAGACLGHVHLRVSSLAESGTFYSEGLGLEVTNHSYPGALFLAAGAYHHHVAINVWAGSPAPRPRPGSAGLIGFSMEVPSGVDVWASHRRLVAAGFEPHWKGADRIVVVDPDGIEVHVVARAG